MYQQPAGPNPVDVLGVDFEVVDRLRRAAGGDAADGDVVAVRVLQPLAGAEVAGGQVRLATRA